MRGILTVSIRLINSEGSHRSHSLWNENEPEYAEARSVERGTDQRCSRLNVRRLARGLGPDKPSAARIRPT